MANMALNVSTASSGYIVHCFSWCAGIKGLLGLYGGWPINSTFSKRSKRRCVEPMCESSHCPGEHWFVFSCSFFEFRLGLHANKSCCTTQNWPCNVAQVEQSSHDQFCRRNSVPFDSSSLVRSSNFSADYRQTNCGVILRIDRPTLLKWNSRHMINFVEKIGDHLWSASYTLFGFGSSSKTHTVNCCFVSGSYAQIHNSSPVTILQTLFVAPHRIFPTFLCTNRQEPFLSVSGIQQEEKFIMAMQYSCNIEGMLVEEMPKDSSISRYVTWRSCINSSRTASMFSGTIARKKDFHGFRRWANVGHDWIN